MFEFFGWLSAIMFSACSFPQAYYCWQNKTAQGISGLFLFLWIGGELFGLVYGLSLGSAPLVCNYLLNLLGTSIILYYFLKDRS